MSNLRARIHAERTRIGRFLLTGVVGALLNVAIFAALAPGLGVDYRIAVVVAFAVSYGFSFVAHRTWTFEATAGHAGHQGARFVLVSAAATAWALLLTVAGVEALGLHQSVAEFVAAVFTAPLAFLLHRRYTFAGTPLTPATSPTPST